MTLVVQKLAIDRGGRRIIADVSLSVAPGEALVLTGPNGAGKTTLLRAIAGFIRPAHGSILLTGGDPDTAVRGQCHFVGHQNAVKPGLSVRENVTFWRDYLGSDGAGEAVVVAALARLGLTDLADIPAAYLSAGQRRRLALTRLVAVRRPLWLLDEPTVSLDAQSVATFAILVGEHLAMGGLLIAATHISLGLSGAREMKLGSQAEAA